MEHLITELVRNGARLYTKEAIEEIRGNFSRVHSRQCNYEIREGSFEYVTAEGKKTAWQFGCYKFYDTKEERDAAREQYRVEQEEKHLRNNLLAEIGILPTETLQKIVESFK